MFQGSNNMASGLPSEPIAEDQAVTFAGQVCRVNKHFAAEGFSFVETSKHHLKHAPKWVCGVLRSCGGLVSMVTLLQEVVLCSAALYCSVLHLRKRTHSGMPLASVETTSNKLL